MGLDFFIVEFFDKASDETAKKFYISVFGTPFSVIDTSIRSPRSLTIKDMDTFKTKIMDILITDTQLECRKKLLLHFNALYNTYESLKFFSRKTLTKTFDDIDYEVITEEEKLELDLELEKEFLKRKKKDGKIKRIDTLDEILSEDLINSGRPEKTVYNIIIPRIIDEYVKNRLYLEIKSVCHRDYNDKSCSFILTIWYWKDNLCDFEIVDYKFLHSNNKLTIENFDKQPNFKFNKNKKQRFNQFFMPYTKKGRKSKSTAIISKLKLYKDLVDVVINIKEQPCIWCLPMDNVKGKCKKCRNLYYYYKLLVKEVNKVVDKKDFLPADLTQIIRRERKKIPDFNNISKYRQQIKEKILKKLNFCYKCKAVWHQDTINLFLQVISLVEDSFA